MLEKKQEEIMKFQPTSRAVLGVILLGAVLSPAVARLRLPTHKLFANVVGMASVTHNASDPLSTQFVGQGKISGFSNDAIFQISLQPVGVGSFEGSVNLVRTNGEGGRRGQGGRSEHLFCSVSGFSVETGDGVTYLGTATVVSGTGRLEGSTGTIYLTAHHPGLLDPDFVGEQAPVEIVLDGDYTTQ
jgi:hypothetical protein